jgi:protein tyrosine phosphatase (PTP) superfamily phosphohydrolase (DUF442 family)
MRRISAMVAATMLAGCAQPLMPVSSGMALVRPTSQSLLGGQEAGPQVDQDALARVQDDELQALPNGDLDRFHQLDAGVFRGARPTDKGLQKLKDKGVRTIISLEDDDQAVAHERAVAKQLGIRHVHIRMNAKSVPKLAQAQEFLKVAGDPAQQPVYFHCKWGRDRTGTMAYVYRISVQGWSHDKAWDECVRIGFRKALLGLNAFIHWYGWKYARQEGRPEPIAVL